jgi:hypothetical protein
MNDARANAGKAAAAANFNSIEIPQRTPPTRPHAAYRAPKLVARFQLDQNREYLTLVVNIRLRQDRWSSSRSVFSVARLQSIVG